MRSPGWICTDEDNTPQTHQNWQRLPLVWDNFDRVGITTASSSKIFAVWDCSSTKTSYWDYLKLFRIWAEYWGSWLLCSETPSGWTPSIQSQLFCTCVCVAVYHSFITPSIFQHLAMLELTLCLIIPLTFQLGHCCSFLLQRLLCRYKPTVSIFFSTWSFKAQSSVLGQFLSCSV